MNMSKYLFPLAALLLTAPDLQAQDSGIMTIEGARIRGDQEMPTVMYLVPWQPPAAETLGGPDEHLMVSQAFAPLERYEFQRLVKYYQVFQQKQQLTAAPGEDTP